MSELTDESVRPERNSHSSLIVILFMIGALVFYVVSPVLVLMIFQGQPPESVATVMAIVFAPLQWLYDNVEMVERFYDFLFMLFSI